MGAEEEEEVDDGLSAHSFDSATRSHHRKYGYLTTNLVTQVHATLADVVAEEVTPQQMLDRFHALAVRSGFRPNPFGVVDPKAEVKSKQATGLLCTMIEYEEVQRLAD